MVVPEGLEAILLHLNPGGGVITAKGRLQTRSPEVALGFDSGTLGATGLVPSFASFNAVKTANKPRRTVTETIAIVKKYFFILNQTKIKNISF